MALLCLIARLVRVAVWAVAGAKAPAGKVGVSLYGDNGRLAALLDESRYAPFAIETPEPPPLTRARVLVLQNVTASAAGEGRLARALVQFVAAGGALFLAGESCRWLASAFPEVVAGSPAPPEAGPDGWIRDALMKVTDGRWVIEEFTGQAFAAGGARHRVLRMGANGRTVILDGCDWPVVIAGTGAAEKVIFSGCDYSNLRIPGKEADVTRTLLAYLAGFAGGPLPAGK